MAETIQDYINWLSVKPKVTVPVEKQSIPLSSQDQRVDQVFGIPSERLEVKMANLVDSIKKELEKAEHANTDRLRNLFHTYMYFLLRDSGRVSKMEELEMTTSLHKQHKVLRDTYNTTLTVSFHIFAGIASITGGLAGFNGSDGFKDILHGLSGMLTSGGKISEQYDERGRIIIRWDIELAKSLRSDRKDTMQQHRQSMEQTKQSRDRINQQMHQVVQAIFSSR